MWNLCSVFSRNKRHKETAQTCFWQMPTLSLVLWRFTWSIRQFATITSLMLSISNTVGWLQCGLWVKEWTTKENKTHFFPSILRNNTERNQAMPIKLVWEQFPFSQGSNVCVFQSTPTCVPSGGGEFFQTDTARNNLFLADAKNRTFSVADTTRNRLRQLLSDATNETEFSASEWCPKKNIPQCKKQNVFVWWPTLQTFFCTTATRHIRSFLLEGIFSRLVTTRHPSSPGHQWTPHWLEGNFQERLFISKETSGWQFWSCKGVHLHNVTPAAQSILGTVLTFTATLCWQFCKKNKKKTKHMYL